MAVSASPCSLNPVIDNPDCESGNSRRAPGDCRSHDHSQWADVVMDTSMGRITCQFYQRQAPKAVANFIGLAEGTKDWTDPTTKKAQHHKTILTMAPSFHRVIPGFMIQGGDPTGTGMGVPATIQRRVRSRPELRPSGAAGDGQQRAQHQRQPVLYHRASYDFLDQHYTLFGQCDDASVEVVKTIARVQRDSNDRPLTPVVLKR